MPTQATTHAPPTTFEEAARLDPDAAPGELEHGRWVPATRNTWSHGELVANIVALLREYSRKNRQWSVSTGDPGTKLSRAPDLLRGPDIGVIEKSRRPTGKGADGWLTGAPDLAVEVSGDSQTPTQLAKKALEYLAAGGKVVWVVDAAAEQVMVFTPPNQVKVLGRDDVIDGGDVLPGFACRLADFFE